MTALDQLDESSAADVAALCARAMQRPPSADELRACLWAPDQPAIVRGDPAVGVVVAVPSEAGGYIRLLAVDPDHQRHGHGTALLAAAEADLRSGRDKTVVTVGADPPYYLFAGVETDQLGMHCLLARRHYERAEANFNMDVNLASLPSAHEGPVVATAADRPAVDRFCAEQWPNWRAEVLRALDKGSLMIDHDAQGISAFCAWDVNRNGLLGPVAVRLDLLGAGAGVGVLVNALHAIRDAGRTVVEVSWVGPIVPYARVGGTIGRVFFVYRRSFT